MMFLLIWSVTSFIVLIAFGELFIFCYLKLGWLIGGAFLSGHFYAAAA